MVKSYIKTQSGAALILVLLIVLFLSITGTVLLNATTYSMKSINQNKIEETEFYSIEGALDLALFEMINYDGGSEPLLNESNQQVKAPDGTPLVINKKGAYFFIKNYLEGRENLKNLNIGKNEIQFQLNATEIDNTAYNVELIASIVSSPSMERKIYLTASVPIKPVENAPSSKEYIQVTGPVDVDNNKDIFKHQKDKFKGYYIGGINFEAKKEEYNLSVAAITEIEKIAKDKKNSSRNLTASTVISESPAYFNEIIGSNNSGPVIIPKDKVVYANSLNWDGNNRHLIVEGTLIIKNFDIQGSTTLEVKNTGTIIAHTFKVWSSSPNVIFPLDTNDDNNSGEEGVPQYTVPWNSKYEVNDYQTKRQ